MDARTHGMRLGGRQYAKRYRTAQGRAGPGLDSRAKTETAAPKPVVTLVMVTKSLRSRRA